MRCAECGGENPDGKRFCKYCGASFSAVCAACGAQLGPDSAFCGDCGTPVGADSVRKLPPRVDGHAVQPA